MTTDARPPLVQVIGPTASGKTAFAVALAEQLGAEVINVDSMQVYRDLAVGTDKPSAAEQQRVPFHGIDLIPLGPPLDAARFAELAQGWIAEVQGRGRPVVAAGGTGLYHRALVHGLLAAPSRDDALRAQLRARRAAEGQAVLYAELAGKDPVAAARIAPTDWVRIERALEVHALTGACLSEGQDAHGFGETRYRRVVLGCWRPRSELYARIDQRLEEMWSGGLVEETAQMLALGLTVDALPLKALGYRQAAAYLQGALSAAEALALAQRETRRFAKRQMTWFRRESGVIWLQMPLSEAHLSTLVRKMGGFFAGRSLDSSGLPRVEMA